MQVRFDHLLYRYKRESIYRGEACFRIEPLIIPILNHAPLAAGLVEPIVAGVKRQGKTISIESLTHQYLPPSALATIYCQSMALVPLDRFE
jgi:hypothetical protein